MMSEAKADRGMIRIVMAWNGVKTHFPRWNRTVFLNDGTGEIFVPATYPLGDRSAKKVFMMALHDGIPNVSVGPHVYIPISWAEKEFPQESRLWIAVRKGVERALANHGPVP